MSYVLPENLRVHLPESRMVKVIVAKTDAVLELNDGVSIRVPTETLGVTLKSGDSINFKDDFTVGDVTSPPNSVKTKEASGRSPLMSAAERGM